MIGLLVVGVDPGQTTGVATLDTRYGETRTEFAQLSPGLLTALMERLILSRPDVLAVERFVVGPRSARSATPTAGQVTRELISVLVAEAEKAGVRVVLRSAAQVKPWATDARLRAAGLYAPDQRHARDAARQALFSAVADLGFPDPLSRRSAPPR